MLVQGGRNANTYYLVSNRKMTALLHKIMLPGDNNNLKLG